MTTNTPIQDTPIQVAEEYISFEDFLKQYEGQYADWIMGEVNSYGSKTVLHQDILGFLAMLLSAYLDFKPVGRVILGGVTMYLGDDKPAREFDLLLVLNKPHDRILYRYLNGASDIAIEIVSPESTQRDYGTKFAEYEAAGVSEYWLFDPLRKIADIYVLTEIKAGTKVYQRAKTDEQGRLISTLLPGFALDPEILWQAELPDLIKTLDMVRAMVGGVA